FIPTLGEAFKPLLGVNGTVDLPGPTLDQSKFSFSGNLNLVVLTGQTLYRSPANQAAQIAFSDLTFGIDFSPGSPLAKGTVLPLTAAAVPFSMTTLLLENPTEGTTADARVDLQGNLDFSSIGLKSLTVGVTRSDYVYVDQTGVTLSGVDASVSTDFTIFGSE